MYNPELEQDLVLASGADGGESWKRKLEDRLKKKTPANKCYEPEEASFVKSVSDRTETIFSKSYPHFDIIWKEIEKQLQVWSPLFRGAGKLHIKKDVPQFSRDMLYKKDRLREQRKEGSKKRKRRNSFTDSYPIHIANISPGSSNQASAVALTGAPEGIDVDDWKNQLFGLILCM
ncbi:hypothetical protein CFAM422_003688 [Trichoderma lentiforme]|uniref:Uncharacterized protein n=1 Tax=Trichoderma lentiforme TaxID=1567552 RepID=A0A9P4XKM9_9HYPO|nr:hypothetical protein CFAM422_003688 [Trichoderma lentiforme]